VIARSSAALALALAADAIATAIRLTLSTSKESYDGVRLGDGDGVSIGDTGDRVPSFPFEEPVSP
jgi:hypothetical protein